MTRAQCIVHRENRLLMVQHQQFWRTWWCWTGGWVEPGQAPAEAALLELREECCIDGTIIRATIAIPIEPKPRRLISHFRHFSSQD
ncbi:NUDIX hydrolase [Chloroflexota bacterium]